MLLEKNMQLDYRNLWSLLVESSKVIPRDTVGINFPLIVPCIGPWRALSINRNNFLSFPNAQLRKRHDVVGFVTFQGDRSALHQTIVLDPFP